MDMTLKIRKNVPWVISHAGITLFCDGYCESFYWVDLSDRLCVGNAACNIMDVVAQTKNDQVLIGISIS